MVASVPSLEASLYLTDPQSIIAYGLRKFFRTPKHAVPLLPDEIISLPWLVAEYGRDPETLTANIQSDLQTCFNRIFAGDRDVRVSTNFTTDQTDKYEVTISVIYTHKSGETDQIGTTLSISQDGRLIIPEDNLSNLFT